ncbi:hypothetical protein OROMI_024182 [Orobanche minor]
MTSPRHPPRSPSHSPRTPRHSPPHSAASPHTHTTSRNPTRCRSMAKRRVDGKKLPLDIDPVRGKLKYEHKVKLSTYWVNLRKIMFPYCTIDGIMCRTSRIRKCFGRMYWPTLM